MRKPVVGVMGGASVGGDVEAMAERLGVLIARHDWVLLNGGRNKGVMAASARGAKKAGGTVIGVLPDKSDKRASPDLDFAILTGLADARNLINVLSSDVVIACPGSLGTMSEVVLALKHAKPVIMVDWDPWEALERYRRRGQLSVADGPVDAVEQVAAILGK